MITLIIIITILIAAQGIAEMIRSYDRKKDEEVRQKIKKHDIYQDQDTI